MRVEDTQLADQFLADQGLALPAVTDEVAARAKFPDVTLANFGPASPMIAHIVEDVVEAGGLDAIDLDTFIVNALACRAVIAADPKADDMLQWLTSAPREEVEALMDRVVARVAAEGRTDDDTGIRRTPAAGTSATVSGGRPSPAVQADQAGAR